MKLWYQENYIDKQAWLLENVAALKLSPAEFLMISLIIQLQKIPEPISLETLSRRSGIEPKEADEVISGLCDRGMLRITTDEKAVRFDVSSIFANEKIVPQEEPLIRVFEQVFKRPLTLKETQRLLEWIKEYPAEQITAALRESAIYHKININYIDKVLANGLRDDD